MKNSILCIVSVLGGMALGSAIALSLAPRTGEQMRSLVRDFINEEVEKWRAANHIKPQTQPQTQPQCEHK